VWPVTEFDLTLWADGATRRLITPARTEIAKTITGPGPLLAEVDAVWRQTSGRPDISLALLWLWYNGEGMAWVRLDEHCEHFARDPNRATIIGEVGGFPDGSGGSFAVPAAEVVTVQQAEQVLTCWLESGARWLGLEWN
jgi:hypothetical protein